MWPRSLVAPRAHISTLGTCHLRLRLLRKEISRYQNRAPNLLHQQPPHPERSVRPARPPLSPRSRSCGAAWGRGGPQTVISSSSGRPSQPRQSPPPEPFPLPAPAWAPAKPHRNAARSHALRRRRWTCLSPRAPKGGPAPSCPDAVTKKSWGAIVSPRPR